MDTGSVIFGIDIRNPFSYSCFHAGVVKLVDARDSKSREPQAHVGSIPTSGTIHSNRASVFEEKFSQGFSNGFDHFLAVPSLISTGLFDSSSSTGLHRLEPRSSCGPMRPSPQGVTASFAPMVRTGTSEEVRAGRFVCIFLCTHAKM